ncbi:MAG: arginine deiminase family protein [Anaerolineae bacterium]|nr:arginine deiminase family protein [Thermoflexales bacterium]MDW8396741.1 arginine deiminase family protein [Anaerolineae bacterium]
MSSAFDRVPKPEQVAEWLPARFVLLCEPRLETLFALLNIESASFLHPFDLGQGQSEHRTYRRLLELLGVQVLDLREVLMCAPIERLRDWARQAVHIEGETETQRERGTALLESTLRVLDAGSLVDLLFLRPSISVAASASGLRARFAVSPVHSAYYTRDPLITTARGCVVTRLADADRQPENDLAAYALEVLGVKPVLRVQAPGTLEGGDFIPCGDFVLQGQGLFTNADGVKQCLEARAYGFVEVAVVEDPRCQIDEMHLDTYFAALDRDLALCCETRLSGAEEPVVHIYQPEGCPEDFRYVLTRSTLFSRYLEEKGIQVIPISKQEQLRYGTNGLLLAPRRWIGVAEAGEALVERLRAHGVEVHLVSYAALGGGYGGLHCSSQVLVRG